MLQGLLNLAGSFILRYREWVCLSGRAHHHAIPLDIINIIYPGSHSDGIKYNIDKSLLTVAL